MSKTNKIDNITRKKEFALTICPSCESSNIIREFTPFFSLAIATQGLQVDSWKCCDCDFKAPIFPEKVFTNEDKFMEELENG
jgi:Zn ribbon nucleic-acid-binding protein